MSLYSQWMEFAQTPRQEDERTQFWNAYFAAEKENYSKILDNTNNPFKGKLADLAKIFDMELLVFVGFIDGINSSLAAGEYDIETLAEDTDIDLTCDMDKLYFNMLDAKADWLYGLEQWKTILPEERKKEITKEFRKSNIFVAENVIGRNDPCPCNSGKKYKKCCGANTAQ